MTNRNMASLKFSFIETNARGKKSAALSTGLFGDSPPIVVPVDSSGNLTIRFFLSSISILKDSFHT